MYIYIYDDYCNILADDGCVFYQTYNSNFPINN